MGVLWGRNKCTFVRTGYQYSSDALILVSRFNEFVDLIADETLDVSVQEHMLLAALSIT